MASFNQVIIIGRLTADPELKQSKTGTNVCSFSLAVDRKFKKDGEPSCDFFECVAWRERAEFVCKYFKKGNQILIQGELQNRSWTDKNGQKRTTTEIIVNGSGFVDSKKDEQGENGASYNPYQTAATEFVEVNANGDDLPF